MFHDVAKHKDILMYFCSQILFCRKRPADDSASEFDSAMSNICQILMNVSRDLLFRSSSNTGVIDENELEFAEYICESMVSLGSSNLQSITWDSTMLSVYLQQVMSNLHYLLHFALLMLELEKLAHHRLT